MNELEKSQEAIEDLIDTLDQQKDEAIIRTFKGVTASFREVFKELVPKGSATMTLLSAEEGGGEGEEGEEEEEEGSGSGSGAGGKRGGKGGRRSSAAAAAAAAGLERLSKVDRYKGVSISVSFTDGKESSNIAGLSGGQRTLVALSLIFAIQRADPAPFYVFDEIDSALDPIHRAAVGALIKKQSGVGKEGGGAQFILSTFHPEILAYGDEFFGVVIQNKTSSVDSMKKVDAVTFVHKILAEEKSKENSGPPAGSKKARAAAGENA
jgi:structural maintenance of chromosome 3 (chondroitin sulfate proteoglycan 6)